RRSHVCHDRKACGGSSFACTCWPHWIAELSPVPRRPAFQAARWLRAISAATRRSKEGDGGLPPGVWEVGAAALVLSKRETRNTFGKIERTGSALGPLTAHLSVLQI